MTKTWCVDGRHKTIQIILLNMKKSTPDLKN